MTPYHEMLRNMNRESKTIDVAIIAAVARGRALAAETLEKKTIGANPATPERFLRMSEVRNRVPYSRATIYRLISEGKFPRMINLGEHAVAWRESEINDWMQSRIANSPAPVGGAQ